MSQRPGSIPSKYTVAHKCLDYSSRVFNSPLLAPVGTWDTFGAQTYMHAKTPYI